MLPVNLLCLNELSFAAVREQFLDGWDGGEHCPSASAGRQGWVALGGLGDAQPLGLQLGFRGKAEQHPLIRAGSCVPGITIFSLCGGHHA